MRLEMRLLDSATTAMCASDQLRLSQARLVRRLADKMLSIMVHDEGRLRCAAAVVLESILTRCCPADMCVPVDSTAAALGLGVSPESSSGAGETVATCRFLAPTPSPIRTASMATGSSGARHDEFKTRLITLYRIK